MTAQHTYLFREGIWSQSGVFRRSGLVTAVSGMRSVVHKTTAWIIEETLTDQSSHAHICNCVSETLPLTAESRFAFLDARHSLFGLLSGKVIIVDDTIMISFECPQARVAVNEYIVKVSDTVYTSDGFMFTDGVETGSWSLQLHGPGAS